MDQNYIKKEVLKKPYRTAIQVKLSQYNTIQTKKFLKSSSKKVQHKNDLMKIALIELCMVLWGLNKNNSVHNKLSAHLVTDLVLVDLINIYQY